MSDVTGLKVTSIFRGYPVRRTLKAAWCNSGDKAIPVFYKRGSENVWTIKFSFGGALYYEFWTLTSPHDSVSTAQLNCSLILGTGLTGKPGSFHAFDELSRLHHTACIIVCLSVCFSPQYLLRLVI